VIDDDPDEYGDVYTLTAMESDTKLFISHHEGGKSTDDATELCNDLESKRSNTSTIPLFTQMIGIPLNGTSQCFRESGAATLLWYWKKNTSCFGAT
jgi:hypothetical protein